MSKIIIKDKEEIEIMRKAGHIAADVLQKLSKMVKPGITTSEIETKAIKLIKKANCVPSFLNFNGYPAATCISINDEIVHGIPGPRVLKNGDIVSIDLGVKYRGYHSDTAITVGVGNISPDSIKLIDTTKLALSKAIELAKPDVRLGDIGHIIQNIVEKENYGVIRDLTGHGIGKSLQEAPSIPNFGKSGEGIILKEGMTIAIEPMVSMGDWHVRIKDDGWTVVTSDHSLASHFEHTITITQNGAEILTK